MKPLAQRDRLSPDRAQCVVIGGSAGAIDVLLTILPALPLGFPLPVVVVVHLPPEERSLLPEIFAPRCRLPVKEAEDKEPIAGGTIYFAAPNYHLLVETDLTFSLSSDEPLHYSRPAIDILFQSAADAYGNSLCAVVLTGASADGAAGLQSIERMGGRALVQDPSTAEAPLMPQSALAACRTARARVLPELARTIAALPADVLLTP